MKQIETIDIMGSDEIQSFPLTALTLNVASHFRVSIVQIN